MWPISHYDHLTIRQLEELALDRRLRLRFRDRSEIVSELKRRDRVRLAVGFISGMLVVGFLAVGYVLGLKAF